MQNSSLDESQDGIKMAGTDFSNLSHADDATLMAVLIPTCVSSSPGFLMTYTAYELSK